MEEILRSLYVLKIIICKIRPWCQFFIYIVYISIY
jgi:hypothetical protein